MVSPVNSNSLLAQIGQMMFEQLNTDQSEGLSREEVAGNPILSKLFDSLPKNDNGEVSLDEFMKALMGEDPSTQDPGNSQCHGSGNGQCNGNGNGQPAPSIPPAPVNSTQFATAVAEWMFHQLDTTPDNHLSKDEAAKVPGLAQSYDQAHASGDPEGLTMDDFIRAVTETQQTAEA